MSPNTYSTTFGEIELTVTPEQMYAAADLLEKATEKVRRILEQLQTDAQQTSSYWEGACAEKERARFKTEDENFDRMIENLSNYAKELKVITGLYEVTEQSVGSSVGSLASTVFQ